MHGPRLLPGVGGAGGHELGRCEINSEGVLACLWSLRRSASLNCLTLSLPDNLRITIQVTESCQKDSKQQQASVR